MLPAYNGCFRFRIFEAAHQELDLFVEVNDHRVFLFARIIHSEGFTLELPDSFIEFIQLSKDGIVIFFNRLVHLIQLLRLLFNPGLLLPPIFLRLIKLFQGLIPFLSDSVMFNVQVLHVIV